MLSPAKATLLTVLAIVALALAFGAGLLVGRYVIPPAPQDAGHQRLPGLHAREFHHQPRIGSLSAARYNRG